MHIRNSEVANISLSSPRSDGQAAGRGCRGRKAGKRRDRGGDRQALFSSQFFLSIILPYKQTPSHSNCGWGSIHEHAYCALQVYQISLKLL